MGGGKLGGYTSSGYRVSALAIVDFLRHLLLKLSKQCRKYYSLDTESRNFRCRFGLVEGPICDLRVKLSGIYDMGVLPHMSISALSLCCNVLYLLIVKKGMVFGYIVL